MNPKRKRVTLLAGVAALVGTAILCTLAGPRPGPALEIAKVFCTVPAWRGRILFPTEHYVWLSNSQALILPDTNAWPPDPHTYIAVSHRDSRGGLLERSGIDIPANESCATVSADGKSIATVEEVGGEPNTGPRPANSGIDLVIHRFGGGPARRVLLSRGIGAGGGGDWSNPLWSKDGTTLYAMRTSNPRMLRAVRLSDSAPTDLSLPQGLFGAPTVRSGADMAPQLLGVTSRNTLLIGTGYVQNGVATFGSGQTSPSYNFPRASIVELSLGSRPAILRRYAPRAPEGVGIGCFVVSPVGDRIFWGAMCERKPSSIELRLHRYLHFLRGEATVSERGWVSNLDGSGLREIGYYDFPHAPSSPSFTKDPWVIDAKWTPDGKRISFIYNDRILTAPVD